MSMHVKTDPSRTVMLHAAQSVEITMLTEKVKRQLMMLSPSSKRLICEALDKGRPLFEVVMLDTPDLNDIILEVRLTAAYRCLK